MTKNSKSIVSTAMVLTVLTLCFKVLGFVKQMVVAYFFGTTQATDVYYMAFNFVGSLSSAFIRAITISLVSIYTHCLVQKGKDEASKLLSACLEILVPVVLVVLLFVYMFTPQIAHMLAPTYSASKSLLLQSYLRICYPFFMFAVVTLVWTSLMDANKDFVVSRTESFITSVVTITCCVLLYNVQAVTSLVIAQYVSYIIFGSLLLIRGRRYFNFTFVSFRDVPEVRTILLTALPLFVGNSVSQINKIVDNALSSGLGDGNVSALSYAVTLEDFVTIILVNNVVDILYVNFSTYTAAGDYEKLTDTMRRAINIMICILLPITIVTCMCATNIVTIIFQRGNFDEASVAMTSAALIGYAVGFTSMGVRDIILRGLYSFKDTKGPMITGLFAVGFNIFFSIILSRFIGIMGISIASSISLTVNFLINSRMLKKHIPGYSLRGHIPVLLKQVPGTVYAICAVMVVQHFVGNHFIAFVLAAAVALSGYVIILLLMRIEEVDYMMNKVIEKIR
ncbi:MAG: polysaccharide biosynthesis C-terminal domain-containing protein [Pseudobutyrivibrio sp.]|nr:polysaccharide biosynthesis C-terminal domain-containing protein [Pseudobutyrivibrio sp.]